MTSLILLRRRQLEQADQAPPHASGYDGYRWLFICETLFDIVDMLVSPELLLAGTDDTNHQKTEDLIGPYELHDFFI